MTKGPAPVPAGAQLVSGLLNAQAALALVPVNAAGAQSGVGAFSSGFNGSSAHALTPLHHTVLPACLPGCLTSAACLVLLQNSGLQTADACSPGRVQMWARWRTARVGARAAARPSPRRCCPGTCRGSARTLWPPLRATRRRRQPPPARRRRRRRLQRPLRGRPSGKPCRGCLVRGAGCGRCRAAAPAARLRAGSACEKRRGSRRPRPALP